MSGPNARAVRTSRARIAGPLLVFFIFSFVTGFLYSRFIHDPARPPSWLPWAQSTRAPDLGDVYRIGVGKADITGPVVEINLMGYADSKQLGTGLRQRLYSRAFIVGSPDNPGERFVYLVLDTQSGDTAVRYGIINELAQMGPEYAVYGHHNIAVTGTHSHSGPGAWVNYLLPQIPSRGFDKQSYRAIVTGAVLSIRRAHETLQRGHLRIGTTYIPDAGINRSIFSYMANPEAERKRYNVSAEDDGSVDKILTMLDFRSEADGESIGVLTWFPTHGTSMLGNNTLITGDNKGVAAVLFEKHMAARGNPSFVAGFSQANVGDVSPNILGAWCEDGSDQMCSIKNSTCPDGNIQTCHGRGPKFRVADNGASSCFEIGRRQFAAAQELLDQSLDNTTPVRGSSVRAFHVFHNMTGFTFNLPNGTEVQTCAAALGHSFAAGTSDGPGAFGFTQHETNYSNTPPMWRAVGKLLKNPGEEQITCQAPKPIVLDVGEVSRPYEWTPNIVDVQMFRVGQFIIIVSPGEATTMAGRRWKEAVQARAEETLGNEGGDWTVVLGGPANSYTHYITTEEEYMIQRYEGASTLYGPHTLAAYINKSLSLMTTYLQNDLPSLPPHFGPHPPDNSNVSLNLITGVVYDGTPLFKHFGDIINDTQESYSPGSTIKATFVGANPRNNLRLEGTFAAVEQLFEEDGTLTWRTIRDDSDWDLVFHWRRISSVLATSEVDIVWETDESTPAGTFRLRYYGDSKSLRGSITGFEGVSSEFRIV